MTKNLLVSSVVLTAAIALTGCSTISSTLGLERHIPDESQVTVHPALTLPPDFNLKPPGTETAVSADHEQAASNATAEGVAPAKPPEEERGFFGKLFHGDFFGNDVDATTAKPDDKGPDVNGTPTAPPSEKPAADASAPAAPVPAASPDVNGTPQAPATK
ncbi:MAG TPA: hypothetical protein VH722_15285 [Alphaproteobacteria bacterium]|nr:hypothetical protein [Alphaproteobacteria bacterium]